MKMFVRAIFALFKRVGNGRIKRLIWDAEFASGKWDYLDPENSKFSGKDIVYDYVEKYSRNGNILDLGCGTGKTGREIDLKKYAKYVGVDLSKVAIKNARDKCAKENERRAKNEFCVSDILKYSSSAKYDVILFQESLYYLNKRQIKKALRKYIHYLTEHGVMIIRLWDRNKYSWIIKVVEKEHRVLDRYWPDDEKTTVIVFK
jgi:SAM-dependent methyltransferase